MVLSVWYSQYGKNCESKEEMTTDIKSQTSNKDVSLQMDLGHDDNNSTIVTYENYMSKT